MDQAALEAMRRSLDLRLDAEGHWVHDGEPFEHPGIIEAFDRGIDLHPDTGEPILRVGEQWCYIRVQDTPFIVRRLREGPEGLVAELNTGTAEVVPADGLRSGEGGVLYVQLDARRRARLQRKVQAGLADRVVAGPDGVPVVRAGDRSYAVKPLTAG